MKITENNIFRFISAGNWILLCIMLAASLIFAPLRFTGGVLAGGLIAILNGYWLYSILIRTMRLPVKKAVRFAQTRYFIRMVLIAVVVAGLIVYCGIDVFGLLLGLSVMVITIFGTTIYLIMQKGG